MESKIRLYIDVLPNEIIVQVLQNIGQSDLRSVLCVNMRCHRIAFQTIDSLNINHDLSLSGDNELLRDVQRYKYITERCKTNQYFEKVVIVNRTNNPVYPTKRYVEEYGSDIVYVRGKTLQINLCPQFKGTSFIHQDTKFFEKLIKLLFGFCPNVISIDFVGVNLIDKHFQLLSINMLKQIRILEFKQCKHITNQLMEFISLCCTQLEFLAIKDCINITDAGVLGIVQRCSDIQVFQLNGASVTKLGVCSISEYCYKLKVLVISDCKKIYCEDLGDVSKTFKKLKYLDISSNWERISDKGIQLLAKNYSLLEYLNISELSHISDIALFALADYCRNLVSLNIQGCSGVTQKGITYVIDKCVMITEIYLQRSQLDKLFAWDPMKRITGFQYLREKYTSLKINKLDADKYMLYR